jgi:hypothetical protein
VTDETQVGRERRVQSERRNEPLDPKQYVLKLEDFVFGDDKYVRLDHLIESAA